MCVEVNGAGSVFVVRFSNYEPAEIASIHATSASALAEAKRLGSQWIVQEWELRSEHEEKANG